MELNKAIELTKELVKKEEVKEIIITGKKCSFCGSQEDPKWIRDTEYHYCKLCFLAGNCDLIIKRITWDRWSRGTSGDYSDNYESFMLKQKEIGNLKNGKSSISM